MALAGREKATILLSILGSEAASRILRYLPGELADLIAAGIEHLPSPSPEALGEVLQESQGFLALAPGGPETAHLPAAGATSRKSYAVLMSERPQTIAFIISLLPPEEKEDALHYFLRERGMVEELMAELKATPLETKLEEAIKKIYAGKVF
jgi:flagellar motor switch protein FliG